jgi:hypothetical protein
MRMRRSRVAVMPSSRMASPTRQSLGGRARAPRIATGRRPQDRPNPGNTDKVVLCLTIRLRAWGGRRREYNHATSFCSGVSGRLCRWVYSWICTWRLCARCWLCPRIWSWRLCARSYDSLRATEPAGAVRKPDSIPALGRPAGTHHQRADVTACVSRPDGNRRIRAECSLQSSHRCSGIGPAAFARSVPCRTVQWRPHREFLFK